jgi:hypothetical protein
VLTVPNSLSPALKQWLTRLDCILSLASCLIIPAVIGGSVVMALERAPEQKFITGGYVWADSASWVSVSIPVTVETQTKKALYRIYIKDLSGDVIYTYPDKMVQDPSQFKLINDVIRLPDLKPGQYQISAKFIYWFNPVKSGTIDFELPNLVIKQ